MNTFKLYSFIDRYPDLQLDEIETMSLRTYSLWSRNLERIKIDDGATNVIAALDTLEGLDYHIKNYIEMKEPENEKNQIHELNAYLNRMGQIYYFVNSEFCKRYTVRALDNIPKIIKIKEFRDKVTAHRSIHYPHKEPKELRPRQAITFMHFAPYLRLKGDKKQFWLPSDSVDSGTEYNYFTPENDHKVIMAECYKLMEEIVKNIT
jgi:hypothetical protein